MPVQDAGFFPFTKGFKTIDCKEAQALEGSVYGSSVFSDVVADEAAITILLEPSGDKDVIVTDIVCRCQDGVTTQGDVIVYEDPTFTAGTTEQTPRNFNRKVGDNATTKIYNDAVYASGGTPIFYDRVYGQRGAEAENAFPAILDPTKKYLAVFTNNSGSSASMIIRVVFGEC